jgi:hypothetical protein
MGDNPIESQDWLQWLIFDPNRQLKCKCGWTGKISEAKEKRVRSNPESWYALGGREGWEYHCPVCNLMLTANYTKVS